MKSTDERPMKRLQGNLLAVDLAADPKGRKRSARTKDGRKFVPSAAREALFKDPATGDWLEPEEWPGVDAVLVCRTVGCPAEGEQVQARVGENVDGVFRAGCGGCQQEITELWVDEAHTPLPLEPGKPGNVK